MTRTGVWRPVLQYLGGKWRMAPWLISHFPPHTAYLEPFGGAASVLMRKPRAPIEVYNDLSEDVINLFRVLRDPAQSKALIAQLENTPFSRTEHALSFALADDPVERARRTVVRAFQTFGSQGATSLMHNTFSVYRADKGRTRHNAVCVWHSYPPILSAVHRRLQRVVIESLPAIEVIDKYATPETMIYVDPPYPDSTVGGENKYYFVNMRDSDHRALAAALNACDAMVVVSGYACPLYDDDLFAGWSYADCKDHSMLGDERVERVWFNRAAAIRCPRPLLRGKARR